MEMEQRAEAAEKSADGLEVRAKNAEARAKAANHTVETTKNRCRDLGILCSYQAVKVRELATMINIFLSKLEEQRGEAKVKHSNPFVKCSSPVHFPTYANYTEDGAMSIATSFESAFGSNETIQGKAGGPINPCKRTGSHAKVKMGMEYQVVRPMWHPVSESPHSRAPRNNTLPSYKGDPPSNNKKKMHSTSKIISKKSTSAHESPWLPLKTTHSKKESKHPISNKTPTPQDCPWLPFKAITPSTTDRSSCTPKTSTTLGTSRSDRSTWWPFKAHKKDINSSPPQQTQPKQKENMSNDVVKTIQKVPLLPLKSILSRDRSYSPTRLSISSRSDSNKSVSFRSSHDNYSDVVHRNYNFNVVHKCHSSTDTKEKEKSLSVSRVSECSLSSSGGGGIEELIVYQGSSSTIVGNLEVLKNSSKDLQVPSSIENSWETDNKKIDAIEEPFGDQQHGSINQLRIASLHKRGSDVLFQCDQIINSDCLQVSDSTTKTQSRSVSPNSEFFSEQESTTGLSHVGVCDPEEQPCLLDLSTLKPVIPLVVAHPTPENVGTSLEIVLYNPDIQVQKSSDLLPQTHIKGEDNEIVPLSMELYSSSPPSRTDPIPPSYAGDFQNNCDSRTADDELQMVVYKHPIASEKDINPNTLEQRISPGRESPIYNNLLQANKNLTPPVGSPEISETSPIVSRETSPRGPHRREIGWNRFFSRSGLSSRKASPRTMVSFVTTQTKTLVPRIRGGGVSDCNHKVYDFEKEKHLHGVLELKRDYIDGHKLQGSGEDGFYSHREQKGNVHLHFQVIKGYHSHRDHKKEHGENNHNNQKKEVLHLNLNDIRKQNSSRHNDEKGMIVTTPKLSLRLNTVQEGFFKEDERRTVIEQRADELSKTCAYQAKKLAEVAHQLQQFPIRLDEQLRRWAALEAKRKYEDRVQTVAQKRICNYGEAVKLYPTTILSSCDAIIQADSETPRSIRRSHVVEDRLLDQLKVVRMMKAVADVRVTFLRVRLKKLEAKLKNVCVLAPTADPYKSEVDVWRCGTRFLVQVLLFGLGFSTLPNILGGISSFPSPT